MPCYGPLIAYRPKAGSGSNKLVFRKSDSETGVGIKIPCGKCVGCRLEHSRQWAVRCMHEKRLHNRSAFLTLTYSDDNLPSGKTLVKEDLQNFMKRLRSRWSYDYGEKGIRFFACGEYGSHTARPHYHVLLLNTDFPDRRLIKTGSEYNLYGSAILSELWPLGHHTIGDVTFQSAAYTARYCTKGKQNGKVVNDGRIPEYIVMSRNPGLGHGYFDRFKDEILAHDTIIVNGVSAPLPRFYDGKIEKLTGTEKIGLYTAMEIRKLARRRKIKWSQRSDNSQRRLRIREVVQLAKLRLKGEML